METKTVKGRKQYNCSRCNGIIRKGQIHKHHKGIMPTFDKNDNQNGIEYIGYRTHVDDFCNGVLMHVDNVLDYVKNCSKGDHVFEEEYIVDHYVGFLPVGEPTGNFYCKNCGFKKE